ncbi:hypothetical protein AX15_006016 [Amanita polypyramis BW_CC]|nr:hypothetical protein AX15_006016 [Amanita polypyramis BW_CC]
MTIARRVAIVTGSASGIGKAIALRLASDGFNLALNGRPGSEGRLQLVADEVSQLGANAIVVPGDVSSEQDVKNVVEETVKLFGTVDAMVANAGTINVVPLTEMTTEQWDKMFAIHARGAFLCYKYAIQQMIKQGHGGRILGISSVYGKVAGPYVAHYCAAKFAIRGLTQSAAQEVGKYGITVNALAPGVIGTALFNNVPDDIILPIKERQKGCAVGRLGEPEDVANAVSFLLSEKSGFITGEPRNSLNL